jgi:signal transduction histidine kinase
MILFKKIGLEQRFNRLILLTIILTSCISIGLIHQFISGLYTNYTNKHWQDYTQTFAVAAVSSVVMASETQSKMIVNSFSTSNNILSANIYPDSRSLISSSNQIVSCQKASLLLQTFKPIDMPEFWCFYAPLLDDNKSYGTVELVVSKLEFKNQIRNLLIIAFMTVLFAAIVIFFVVKRLSGIFTSTLDEMKTALKKFTNGERGTRANFRGSIEIESICEAFNEMLKMAEQNENEFERRLKESEQVIKQALDHGEVNHILQSQIMSLASHEIKTPLNSLSMNIEILKEELILSSEYNEMAVYLNRAMVSAKNIADLIERITVHAKMAANQYVLNISNCDIQSLVNQSLENIETLLQKNKNTLLVEGQPIFFNIDEQLLSHIIVNLISNACKFTHNGTITIKYALLNNELVIVVSDTGIGIPNDHKDKIFSAWWQVDMTLSRKYGGSGLGLAITKQFVTLLSGKITVTDNNPRGSVFKLSIPTQIGHPQLNS